MSFFLIILVSPKGRFPEQGRMNKYLHFAIWKRETGSPAPPVSPSPQGDVPGENQGLILVVSQSQNCWLRRALGNSSATA